MTMTRNANTDRIRGAYVDNRKYSDTGYVSLAALREDSGLTSLIFEATIRSMIHDDDVIIIPESNQKALTQGVRAGAVVIGNQDNHWIKIG